MARKIVIELVVEEEYEGDAETVVEALLDEGLLQDGVNGHEYGDHGSLKVLSATVRDVEEVPSEPCEGCGERRIRARMMKSAGAYFGDCCWEPGRMAADPA